MSTLACLLVGNGTVLAEIGPNIFPIEGLVINKSRTPGGKSASFTIKLSVEVTGPKVPSLVKVIGSDGTGLFAGLYLNEDVKFIDNGQNKQYNVTVNDFFSFTRRNAIADYRKTLTFSQHINTATLLGTAYSSSRPLNPIEVVYIQCTTTDPDITGERPDPFTIPYEFQFEGYLNDFISQQCEIADCNWEIVDSGWPRVATLTSGYIARIIVRKNDIVAVPAPRDVVRPPLSSTMLICPATDGQIQNMSVTVRGPSVTRCTLLGLNGKYDVIIPTTQSETVKHNIPAQTQPGGAPLGYSYPETATIVTAVRITPNDEE